MCASRKMETNCAAWADEHGISEVNSPSETHVLHGWFESEPELKFHRNMNAAGEQVESNDKRSERQYEAEESTGADKSWSAR
jgi:hypothetical protein